ncbi:MgtC/SapB family protein [Ectobacillus polymachus]|uniref:MgtC/SapB family protein n=1 Tax=Ectobacillus polymachus TaxID=1508806 RepID=UPI003A88DE19
MAWQDMTIRLLVAILTGACIGTERQWRHRMAGIRTNALVSLGACLFVILSVMSTGDNSPTRIAAQVVSGVGFLGGGVIIREGFSVRGLNTAATLWCSAAVGTLVGAGFMKLSIIGAIGVVLANVLLRPIALFMNRKSKDQSQENLFYEVNITCLHEHETVIRTALSKMILSEGIALQELYSEEIESGSKVSIMALLHSDQSKALLIEQIVSKLKLEHDIIAIGWKTLSEQEGD